LMFFTIFFGCSLLHMPMLFLFYPFSRHLWREYIYMFIQWWYTLLIITVELGAKLRCIVTGDRIPVGERAVIISNHPSECDWINFFSLAYRKGTLGGLKIMLKKEIRFLPAIGQAMDTLEWIFVERKRETDQKLLEHRFKSWAEDKVHLWLFLFPEGTDYSQEKRNKSITWAKEHGVNYEYKNLLVPRVTGFITSVEQLRNNVDVIYDLTIGYQGKKKPTFLRCVLGIEPTRACFHIRRFPISEIPRDEEGLTKWLYECFKTKDELLENFKATGSFPPGEIGPQTLKPPRVLYFWLAWWILLTPFWIYCLAYWSHFKWLVLIANIPVILTVLSSGFRRWRGLEPPLDYGKEKSKGS